MTKDGTPNPEKPPAGSSGQVNPGRDRLAPWDRTLESWNPIGVVLLAIAGAAGAVVLLLLGSGTTPQSQAFVASDGFTSWAAVIAVQGGYWSVVAAPLWREVLDTIEVAKPSRFIWMFPCVVALALVGLLLISPARGINWPLAGHGIKMTVLTCVAAVGVGIPSLFGVCLVQDRVRRHRVASRDTSTIQFAVVARAQLKRFLGLAGATIGLAVLASGALQKAVVPDFVSATAFPASSVVLYGAFFTAILFVVYFPAHLSLRRLCADAREAWYPSDKMPLPSEDQFADWVDGRARLDGYTQLNLSAAQHLQAAVFVLTPLVSGIISSLLPTAA